MRHLWLNPYRRLFVIAAAAIFWGLVPASIQASEEYPELANRRVKEWKLIRDEKGIQVYRGALPDTKLVAFKGVSIIEAPIERVINIILDPDRSKKWAHTTKEYKVLKWIKSPVEFVEYNLVGMPFMVADRDFVSRIRITASDDLTAFRVTYLDPIDPVPDTQSIVRGDVRGSYYVAVALDANRTELTGVATGDPKGLIPIWVVNWFQRNWPYDTLRDIQKAAAKNAPIEQPRYPALRDYFSTSTLSLQK